MENAALLVGCSRIRVVDCESQGFMNGLETSGNDAQRLSGWRSRHDFHGSVASHGCADTHAS